MNSPDENCPEHDPYNRRDPSPEHGYGWPYYRRGSGYGREMVPEKNVLTGGHVVHPVPHLVGRSGFPVAYPVNFLGNES